MKEIIYIELLYIFSIIGHTFDHALGFSFYPCYSSSSASGIGFCAQQQALQPS